MRHLALATALLVGFAAVPFARADQEFDTLQNEFAEAQQAWSEKLQEIQKEDGTYDEASLPPRPSETFLPRFKAYAEKHAGTAEAIPALAWIIDAGGGPPLGDAGQSPDKWAVERLTKDHAGDPALAAHLPGMRYAYYTIGAEPLIALYERVMKVNQDKDAAAWATFNLGFTVYRGASERPSDDKTSGQKDRAAQLFRRTVKEYAGTRPAEYAAGYIYEIENLQIGMKAPEIVGTDVDGKEIKLSQFRGQVVVLDFWGFW